jgi:hypothetical protein
MTGTKALVAFNRTRWASARVLCFPVTGQLERGAARFMLCRNRLLWQDFRACRRFWTSPAARVEQLASVQLVCFVWPIWPGPAQNRLRRFLGSDERERSRHGADAAAASRSFRNERSANQ